MLAIPGKFWPGYSNAEERRASWTRSGLGRIDIQDSQII
jgi:hypothetical protein